MRKAILAVFLLASIAFLSERASAQAKTTVRFARGSYGTTVKGTVRGYAYHDYILGVSAGQTIDLKLTANGSPSVFTVFRPNEDNLDGAAETVEFSGELPSTGNYIIRVLMMRSEARRKGAVSTYSLKISIK